MPERSTWYLTTNLPVPDSEPATTSPWAVADLAEVVRLYGLRIGVEQSYNQIKGTLGWAEYQVRDDVGIRRHWQLVCCAFSFCWWALDQADTLSIEPLLDTDSAPVQVEAVKPPQSRSANAYQGEKKAWNGAPPAQLARGAAQSPGLAGTVSETPIILASLVQRSSTCSITSVAG